MFYFGVDYYPEHWPEERWVEDTRLMAEAHFNVARLAEFAWSKMEPRDGHFDFAWLDRAISLLASRDIRVILGTPTASPPPWLMTRHPDLYRMREDGQRVTYGNRRPYCPGNPLYHDYSKRIVAEMAEHYRDHPAVIGWQIDNEFGDRCYCPICARHFWDWLRCRYGSLDEINEKWGTVFWSHVYTDWDQIPVPLTTGNSPNPGLALDFFRFSSSSYVAYQQAQMDILRKTCPQHFITHNFMGFKYDRIDYFDLARNLDFVSWDNYPRTQWGMQAEVNPGLVALAADTMRGLKRHNFWVMEQQAGPGGWEIASVMPRPGELRLWAYQSIAHGSDAILFFRWRTARFGTEQYWHGLLDYDGVPGRRYHEIKQMGAEIKQIGERIRGSILKPRVAMLLCYDSRFAFQVQGNNPWFSYSGQFEKFYSALYHRQVPVDIVQSTADLSAYRLVIAPALHIVPESVAENLTHFVRSGGVLVLTPRCGVKDESNAVVNRRLPGLLAELCGIEVEEYDSLSPDMCNALEFALPELACTRRHPVNVWCDVLRSNGATVVAHYTQDYYARKPAITLNQFGQLGGGRVVYIGTLGDVDLYRVLTGWLLDLANVQPLLAAPEGVEVTERWDGDQRLMFVLNHTNRDQQVRLDRCYANLLNDSGVLEGTATIASRDILVLLEDR